MMNYIYISPNYPDINYYFCKALNNNHINVLGIGDISYDLLKDELKETLKDYFYIKELDNLDEYKKAVNYFADKYGQIDYIESNNDKYLEYETKLKDEYNIVSNQKDILDVLYKSKMKDIYNKADIKTARYQLLIDYQSAKDFIDKVDYPVIIKKDKGVDFDKTFIINNDEELHNYFFNEDLKDMIIEEYINGDLVSYDAIINSKKEVLYETSFVFPRSILNIFNDKIDCFYWSIRNIPSNLKEIALNVIEAFNLCTCFCHLEFFILKEDKNGLGSKGDIIAFEVNKQPIKGRALNMMNYASDIDIFDIYADMIKNDTIVSDPIYNKYYCVYTSRRNRHKYCVPLADIKAIYQYDVVSHYNNDVNISEIIGDEALIARFENREDIWPFINAVVEEYK